MAGVNRIGRDGNDLDYDGFSAVISPQGTEVLQAGTRPGAHHCTLELTALRDWRERFPAWIDADRFQLLD